MAQSLFTARLLLGGGFFLSFDWKFFPFIERDFFWINFPVIVTDQIFLFLG